jgi:hypothetical protein
MDPFLAFLCGWSAATLMATFVVALSSKRGGRS